MDRREIKQETGIGTHEVSAELLLFEWNEALNGAKKT